MPGLLFHNANVIFILLVCAFISFAYRIVQWTKLPRALVPCHLLPLQATPSREFRPQQLPPSSMEGDLQPTLATPSNNHNNSTSSRLKDMVSVYVNCVFVCCCVCACERV